MREVFFVNTAVMVPLLLKPLREKSDTSEDTEVPILVNLPVTIRQIPHPSLIQNLAGK